MGIEVEFNPDLALRNIEHYKRGERSLEECIPENLESGKTYDFLKKGQRNYWFHGELALLQTEGGGNLSRPLASIKILEATHYLEGSEVFTKGKYQVMATFDPEDPTIQFEWLERTYND
tara:strand:+ start:453 stop:809 length:357 start_codon:yes stop_codon:yes gene_type:complete